MQKMYCEAPRHAAYSRMVASFARRATLGVIVYAIACSDDVTGPAPGSDVRRLMVSENATCALDPSGTVFCWGVNGNFLEFGSDAIDGSFTPVAVPVPKLAWLARGVGTHLCGITTERDAVCWGRGTFGQLGHGTPGATGNPPSTVQGSVVWADVAVGRITTCGHSEDGTGFCWGHNQRGEVGGADVPIGERVLSPRAVDGGFNFKQVVAGWLHACGIKSTGEALCWGGNNSGQLGIGRADTVAYRTPQTVVGGHQFERLTLGSRYTCGITTTGDALCWGGNATGQLGDGTTTARAEPTPVATTVKFAQIAAGSGFASSATVAPPTELQGGAGHTCALTGAGKAYCWGWNGDGQLGDGSVQDRLAPVEVKGNLAFSTISLASANTCGMRGNGVWCWGSNLRGQLGRDTFGASAVEPVPVSPPFNRP